MFNLSSYLLSVSNIIKVILQLPLPLRFDFVFVTFDLLVNFLCFSSSLVVIRSGSLPSADQRQEVCQPSGVQAISSVAEPVCRTGTRVGGWEGGQGRAYFCLNIRCCYRGTDQIVQFSPYIMKLSLSKESWFFFWFSKKLKTSLSGKGYPGSQRFSK